MELNSQLKKEMYELYSACGEESINMFGVQVSAEDLKNPWMKAIAISNLLHEALFSKRYVQEVYDDTFNLFESLNQETDIGRGTNTLILQKSILDFKSLNYVDAIKEFINEKEFPISFAAFMRIKEPWLIVDGSSNDGNSEIDQERIFQNMLKFVKPELMLEKFEVSEGDMITPQKINNIMFNTVSSIAFEKMLFTFYHLLQVPEIFEDLTQSPDQMTVALEDRLSEITFSIAGVIMKKFEEEMNAA